MKLKNVTFCNNVIWENASVSFEDGAIINTISGKNGSGKTSLFSQVVLVQKAFFCDLLEKNGMEEYDGKNIRGMLGREINKTIKDSNGSVTIQVGFEERDFAVLKGKRAHEVYLKEKNENEEVVVEIELYTTKTWKDIAEWDIRIEEKQRKVLNYFWNLETPVCFFAFIKAERVVIESDIKYEDVRLRPEGKYSKKLKIIFESDNLYNSLYSIMVNDYISERIIPGKAKTKKDRYVANSRKLFEELYKKIKIENFSGTEKYDQFILTARGEKTGKYDIRYCSSGEKLIWYTLVLINYIQNMGILIIDEPENHLHESLLWKFVLLLKKTAEEETNQTTLSQVFLLTHSKNLIYNNFTEGLNFVIDDKNLKLLEYEKCESILRNIGVSCINEKILFVEGITDQELLQDILSEDNIHINVLGNCNAVVKAYEGMQEASTHIQDKRFVFMIDKDTKDEQEITLLRNENPEYFDSHVLVLDRHEIENFLLDEKIICDSYNQIAEMINKPKLNELNCIQDMKEIADSFLDSTKRKYLNYLLHRELSHIDSLIDQKEIKLENENEYKDFIDKIFSSSKWEDVLSKMKSVYLKMQGKYSKENWEKEWKKLCDGKTVYNQLIANLSSKMGIKKNNLHNAIVRTAMKDESSMLSELVKDIIKHFDSSIVATDIE